MKRKHFLLTLYLSCFAILAQAITVEPMRALEVARQFVAPNADTIKRIQSKTNTACTYKIVYTHHMPKSGDVAFYVVSLGETGFVIISGNDIANPIIGYSYTNNWPSSLSTSSADNLPSQLLSYLDDMAMQIESALEQMPTMKSSEEWQQIGQRLMRQSSTNLHTEEHLPDSIGPLLTTTWAQGQYYNALCPDDPAGEGGHALTGCIATAMAQIIHFWKYPTHARGVHNYDCQKYGNLSVDYNHTFYDFNNMPNALTAESSADEVNAVAKLMYECGVAVNMEYNVDESSAYTPDARAALINYYRFSPNLSMAEKAYFTTEEWENMLRKDLAAGRPIYYSGQQGRIGHSFICDGYNQQGYFSFNFGWGGAADGWYMLDAISPVGMNFSSQQTALLGIVPDTTGNVIIGQTHGVSTFQVDGALEFYHIMGHNAYAGNNYMNDCSNNIIFESVEKNSQLVMDIVDYEDQNLTVIDPSNGQNLKILNAGQENDLSPIVSSSNTLSLYYTGNMFYSGFQVSINTNEACRRVSNIITSVDTTTIHMIWKENGTATSWEVEYGESGFEIGTGVRQTVSACQYDIVGLKKFTEYDIYIRPICSADDFGDWSKTTVLAMATYWTEVVHSQPSGYTLMQDTFYVEISTPEAFAWWAKNGGSKHVYLTADLDMSAYRWKSVNLNHTQFYGNGHKISGIYIRENEGNVGLFGIINESSIVDLGLIDSYVEGAGSGVGGLCGSAYTGTIRNSYVRNSVVIGGDNTGGLLGSNGTCTVENSFVNTYVSGMRWAGLFIGSLNYGNIHNCYAAGELEQRSFCYNGGIVSYASNGSISNCYSTPTPMGIVGYVGTCNIVDTSSIVYNDLHYELEHPIAFDTDTVTDLLQALNIGVAYSNDSTWRLWKVDESETNKDLPVLGEYYSSTCANVEHISLENAVINNKNAVIVAWEDNGESLFEIRYRRHDAPTSPYTYIETTTPTVTIYDIPLGHIYDFNVRVICATDKKSGWSPTQNFIVDIPYWTDIVVKQPEGFTIDTTGNVTISSAEGLAWLGVLVHGLHGQTAQSFANKEITFANNISLAGYRWRPIGHVDNPFSGHVDGNNFAISNLYVNETATPAGLFGRIDDGSLKNINLVSGKVSTMGGNDDSAGGLAGLLSNCTEVSNCHSAVEVHGIVEVGSLVGEVENLLGDRTLVTNCSASGSAIGRESVGGLIGAVYGAEIRNCYATGDVLLADHPWNPFYRAGLIGNFMYAKAYNCFSTGIVEFEEASQYFGKVIGCPYQDPYIQYVYGQADINTDLPLFTKLDGTIKDTTQFVHVGESYSLLQPISIGGVAYTDLIAVLNAWVTQQNDPALRTWVVDNVSGYPVFGENFVPSCYNPTNVAISNATIVGDSTIRTQLSWNQEGTANTWEILYVHTKGSIEDGSIIRVNTNPCVLTDIPTGRPLDFYVRAICSEQDTSSWSNPVTYIPDKLHWTDVVTSQPEGYTEDELGNVFISSAEGLSWVSSRVNALNGQGHHEFNHQRIFIIKDIDLSQYRWTPIGGEDSYIRDAIFNGNNHEIKGLYVNDLADNRGLFGSVVNTEISNLHLKDCEIHGLVQVASIASYISDSKVYNCRVTGKISGVNTCGGLCGQAQSTQITNSSFIGDIYCREDVIPTNTIRGYMGSAVGGMSGGILSNCYLVCEIADSLAYTGVLVGFGSGIDEISYCYFKDYSNRPANLSPVSPSHDNSSFSGSDTIWTLYTPSYVNGAFYSDLQAVLNAWVDANNTHGKYLHWVADAMNTNNGLPIFNEIPQYKVTFNNWDGTLLQSSMVCQNNYPYYAGETPIRPEDDRYIYTFIGWNPALSIIVEDVDYVANYEATEKSTPVLNNEVASHLPRKVLINGRIYMIVGEKTYSIQGHRIQ